MKYKVGDKVKIKSKDWYEENKDENGDVELIDEAFKLKMIDYLGKCAVVKKCLETYYEINIDSGFWNWTDEMFEDENEEHGQITLPAPSDPQALLNQISILTQTLSVLCATGRAKSASIVEEKIMQLIEKL